MENLGIVIVLFTVVAVLGIVLSVRSKKQREKRRDEEAARTDGTPFDPSLDPNQVPGNVWNKK